MCGITGIAPTQPRHPVDREALARMTGMLRHRGPDSDGFHIASGVGLGVRRLRIVDLHTGDQPIANEDGTIIVVCNGEIYNHIELRTRLLASGHRFRTASDTEVIVHLYEDHGDDFVLHLRGMFGLALWDERRRRLVLSRDRLGIKPLHYAVTAAGLLFGSEQKAILAAGVLEPRLDFGSLRQLLSYGRIIAPRTLLTGVRRVPAGHSLIWSEGRADIRQYWDVCFPARADYDRRVTPQEWANGVHERLRESVQLHLRSDVPVGAALSAGIDSSSVTALMAQMLPDPVQTFTLRFDEPGFDELRTQKALDEYPEYGLAGHRIPCRRSDMERMPDAVWHGEDLLLGGVVMGLMMMAESAESSVKVLLTGEGADEVFGGYSWYPTTRVLAPLFALPRSVRRLLSEIPPIRRRWPGAAGMIAGPRAIDFERYSRSISHLYSQAAHARLLSASVRDELQRHNEPDETLPPPSGFATWHPFAQLQYFDLKHRMADVVVQSLDRGSMAHSVEARVPFLDHEFVEYCARIPPHVKMKGLREKHVLRQAMAGTLPHDIASRKKFPMQVPLDPWLRGDLPAFASDLLSDTALRNTGYFDPDAVRDLRQRQQGGQRNLWQVLSIVLGVQVWHDQFLGASFQRRMTACATP